MHSTCELHANIHTYTPQTYIYVGEKGLESYDLYYKVDNQIHNSEFESTGFLISFLRSFFSQFVVYSLFKQELSPF